MPPVSSRRLSSGLVTALIFSTVAALTAQVPARARDVTVQGRGLTLREVTERLSAQSGYPFYLQPTDGLADLRADVDLKALSLARALTECADLFRCEFYSTDSRGIYVIARQRETNVRESMIGPYKLRVGPIVPVIDEPNSVHLTLILSASDDEVVEQLAGLEGDVRVRDNFGRDLIEPTQRFLLGNSQTRVRLTEYWLRLALTPRDSRSVRVRSATGTLLRYRKVKLLKFEFPLNDPARPPVGQVLQEQGVEFRLERLSRSGQRLTIGTMFRWAENRTVVGRGISRVPEPYLVDSQDRVLRDPDLRQSRIRDGNGNLQFDQTLEFSRVPGEPVKLVYEVFVKEDPEPAYPFRLENLPLPSAPDASRTPFYQRNGASLSIRVVGPSEERVEGEVALALSRKEASGWTGWHWLERVTEPDGTLKVAHLRPGTYRVQCLFRTDPAGPPLPMAQPLGPLEVTLAAAQDTPLPNLRLKAVPRSLRDP